MASTNVLVHLNMNGNEIQNVLAQKLATAPSNPSAGQFYYNTSDNILYVYNGTTWLNALAQGTTYTNGSGITISNNQISVDFNAVATAAQGAKADTALQPNDNISELTNDAGYITNSALSGYVPTSRTVNGKALTTNITLSASDVAALPNTVKYGASFVASLNTTDYKLTMTLQDQDGNTLGTSQVVDFPIESVVVGGSYDSTNKKIVLTLQNGNTIDVPVGDLINGLQSEITSTNKLSADLVDDTSTTHKFATAAQLAQIATNTNAINLIEQSALRQRDEKNPILTPSGGICQWELTTPGAVLNVIRESDGNHIITDIQNTYTETGDIYAIIKINSNVTIPAETYTATVLPYFYEV